MARYSGPKCKLCRREGVKLFLKGTRCLSDKCPIERKGPVPPGQHGLKRRRKSSEYGIQLREKQKTKRFYGVKETQFHNYYLKAAKQRGNAGVKLLQLLEMRLDNVVFRGGLVPSRSAGRQLISHGHVLVNGKKVNIPSCHLKPGDTVLLSTKAMGFDLIKKILADKNFLLPKWLKRKAAVIKVDRLPEREEMDADVNESLIVEFYSR